MVLSVAFMKEIYKQMNSNNQSGRFGGSNILEPGSNIMEPQNFIFNILDRHEEKKL